jgi:uncharacterized protein (TIGR02996 family)
MLAAIVADPDDDGPRLIYADWLVGKGEDDRAEFIRIQCALKSPQTPRDTLEELRRREAALQSAHGRAWKSELPRLEGVRWRPYFHRGFLDAVDVSSWTAFTLYAQDAFAAAPLRGLLIRRLNRPLADILASPLLGRLRELDLRYGGIGPAGAAALADAAVLGRYTGLGLTRNGLGDGGVAALAGSPHLGRLRSLGLAQNGIGDEGARLLAAAPALRGLAELHLCRNGLTDAGARALAASPHLAGLTGLCLTYNRFGAAGASALAASPHLGNLEWLDLRFNRIDSAAKRALRRRFGRKLRL